MKKTSLSLAAIIIAGILTADASARLRTFDENSIPTNPINGFGSFTFEDFGGGAVTDGPNSLILDVTDTGGNVGVFGGIGVDYLLETPPGSGDFVPQDFDPSNASYELSVKILDNNEATAIRTTFIDDDGAGSADEHVYEFDLTAVPNDGQFHVLSIPLTTPLFTQGAFGLAAGNGMVDPGLRQMQIQSVFGSTGRLNVEVDFARIVVPEPASIALLLSLAGVACGIRRRS